ncbi:MAG: prolyl oligopeptidase family serine peptidase [Bacteroides sp.]|nr:prolyl oligopeptidase family serine peptidase [Bacteroides sp.]
MKNLILTLAGFALLLLTIPVQAQEQYLHKEHFSQAGDTLKYRLLEPENRTTGIRYPLVIFLHGMGERGSDNEAQLINGGNMFLNPKVRDEYPAYILFPQCPVTSTWSITRRPENEATENTGRFPLSPEITTPMQSLIELIEGFIAQGNIDTSRIYVMGLSMGGMGTFDLICRRPDLFAAAVPICGGINPQRIATLNPDVKLSIYHGDKDDVVSVDFSREVYRALKAIGKELRYIEFPGCGHNAWDPTLNDPELLKWMFSQKK